MATTAELKCCFCGKSEQQDSTLDGRLLEVEYGKFEWAWTHYSCAVWTPEVSVDDDGTFHGVDKGVKRGKQIVCFVCISTGSLSAAMFPLQTESCPHRLLVDEMR